MSHDLDENRLGGWLEQNLPGFKRPILLTKFANGQSNPTFKVQSESGSYVLRRKPLGTLLPSAHAIDREYGLLSALWPLGFPVPQPYCYCSDVNIIGSDFYVMGMAVGQNYSNGSLPDLTPDGRRQTYLSMVDTLASLHQIDAAAAGLANYGKPGNYFERQIG
ncbi:MAG: phosphotransferase family protein, partial [Betaproteobacteria bacterium]